MLQHALRNNVRSRVASNRHLLARPVLRCLKGAVVQAQASQSCSPVISPFLGDISSGNDGGDNVQGVQESILNKSSPVVADYPFPVLPEQCIPGRSRVVQMAKAPRNRSLRESRRCSDCDRGAAAKGHAFMDAHHRNCILGDPNMFVGDDSFNLERGYDPDPLWIPPSELKGLLKTAVPTPCPPEDVTRLIHPSTREQLVLRLHQTLAFTPIPSLPRLVRYHNSYLSLQSSASFNFLIQLAIRHSAYGLARRLFSSMEASHIRLDEESKLLFIRLLVRTGHWTRAWRIVYDEFTQGGSKPSVDLLPELFGRLEREEYRTKRPQEPAECLTADASAIRAPKTDVEERVKCQLPLEWQSHVTSRSLEVLLPANNLPSDRFVYMAVRHLLRTSQTKKARALTLMWLSRLPRCLSLPQKRRCLNILHLHLGLAGTGARVHFEGRKLVDKFLKLRPYLHPTSSTLYLLLRSLRRVRKNPTFFALQLVNAYQKRWSSAIVDQRVRRCVVHIAVKEGRMNVARRYLSKQTRAEAGRKALRTIRQAFGVEQVKPPIRPRKMYQRKLMPGISLENRHWRWTRRRFWRRISHHHGRLQV